MCRATWRCGTWVLLVGWCFLAVSAGAAKAVLEIGDWWNPQRPDMQEWWAFVEAEFEQRHPGVDVQFVWYTGTGDAREKLIVSCAAGTAPDVTQVSVAFGRELYTKGIFLTLNSFIDRDGQALWNDRFPISRVYAEKDGAIFGIPHDLASTGLVYDVDAFASAGLDPDPFAIGNWVALREAAKKLTRSQDGAVTRYGLAGGIGWEQSLAYWLAANGAAIYSPDFRRITVNSPQAKEAVEYVMELQFGLGVLGGTIDSGTAAMQSDYGTFASLSLELARPDLTFRMTSMPPGPSGQQRTTVTWSNMVSVVRSTKQPDIAWEYVKFYTGPEMRQQMLRILNRISANRSLYASELWRRMVQEHAYMATFGHMAEAGTLWPFVGTSTAIAAVVEEVTAIVSGKTGPAAGLEQAAVRGTALLDDVP